MKKVFFVAMILCVCAAASFAALVDVNAAYVSKYIWRGFDLNATQPAIQPGLTFYLPVEGLTLGLWGSYNIGNTYPDIVTGNDINRQFTELDGILSYASNLGDNISYSLCYTYMTFPILTGDAAKSGEISVNLIANNLLFTPTLLVAYDHDQGKGTYASLSGKTSIPAGPLSLSALLTAGYNGGQWGATPGFSDGTFALSTQLQAGALNISPSVNYVVINNDSNVNTESSVFWFGVNVASSI